MSILVIVFVCNLVKAPLPQIFMQHVKGVDVWEIIGLVLIWQVEAIPAIACALVLDHLLWAKFAVKCFDSWNEFCTTFENMLKLVKAENQIAR